MDVPLGHGAFVRAGGGHGIHEQFNLGVFRPQHLARFLQGVQHAGCGFVVDDRNVREIWVGVQLGVDVINAGQNL